MVKIRQNSGSSENTRKNLSQPARLNNTSCSAENGLKLNGSSHHALKISALNINGADKGPVKEIPLTNGSCSKAVNGVSAVEMPAVNGTAAVNGKIDNNVPAKEVPAVNGKIDNKVPAKEVLAINGKIGNKVPAKEDPAVNGHCSNKVTVNETPVVNGKFANEAQSEEMLAPKGRCWNELSTEEISLVNGNCNKDNVTFLNGSKTPSESGCSSISHLSDSLYNEDNSDEDQHGFTEVVGKKNRKKKIKNYRNKPISNLPPGLSSENIKRDKGHDKNHDEKVSPTHLSQTPSPPSRNFAAVRSSGKSYSSALMNGQNGNPQLKNSGPSISPGTQNVTNSTKSKKPVKDFDSSGTHISVSQSSTNTAKITSTNDSLPVSCKQSNLLTKVEMTDGSAQTDLCSEKKFSINAKEFLPSTEVTESETACSPVDYFVDDTDSVVETTNGSSNAAYCESVASNDSGRGDSEATYEKNSPFCCEFPKEKASQLIGKGGSFKKRVERETGIELWVCDHLFNENLSIVRMIGPAEKVEEAKKLIWKRFPNVQLKQWIGLPENIPLSEQYYATLPEGTSFPAIVSGIATPDFFWVQPHGHPQFHALQGLETRMSLHFDTVTDAPGVYDPRIGHVVAVPWAGKGWVRGEIVEIDTAEGQLRVLLTSLDHGGYICLPASELRPMRSEFLSIPFFASVCKLYGIQPTGGDVWAEETLAEFTRLVSNGSCPPHAFVVQNTPEGYFLQMWGFDTELGKWVDIALTLITKGLAIGYGFYQPVDLPTEFQH